MTVTGLDQAVKRLTLMPGLIVRAATAVFSRRLAEARDYARTTYLSGGTTATRLAVHTGRVRDSFDFAVQQQPPQVVGRLGFISMAPSWVGIHEYGGTIYPRQAQALAIPLTAEARAAGSPRNFPGETFLARSRAGNAIIFARAPGGGITPEYVLRQQVTIPARPALAPTVARYAPIILEDLRQAVSRGLQGERP